MKKILSLLLGLSLASTAFGAANRLNLFIWSEYIDPAIVKDFEKEFKCKVVIDTYEEEAAMTAKLKGGGASKYDIVLPPDHSVPVLVKLGLLAPLRPENIPNLKNLDAPFTSPSYDPGNKYSAAYQWGTVGIYVRKTPGKEIDESWGVLFDPAKQPGQFIMIDNMRDIIGAGLKYKGYSLNSTDPEQLKTVRDLLIETKKRTAGFEGGVGGKNKVLAKGATAAIVYSGDAIRGTIEDKDTYYFVPKEGSQIWVDNMVVPAKAPHRDLAEKFIDFILRPDVGARLANFNKYATPNKAALPKIEPADLKNPSIYPSAEVMKKLEFLQDLGKDTKLYDEVWTQVKAK